MSDVCILQNTRMKSASPSDASEKQFGAMRITKVDRVLQSELELEYFVSLFLLLVCWSIKKHANPPSFYKCSELDNEAQKNQIR